MYFIGFQVVTVGHEGEVAAFLSWRDPMPFYVNYVGVCTGWGAQGTWVIDDQGHQNYQPQGDQNWQQPAQIGSRGGYGGNGGGGGSPCWVPSSNGQVPPDAVQGGTDGGEPIYVAR